MEQNSNNERVPLLGANVFWLNTTLGTMTADDGTFTLPYDTSYKKLVISYIGLRTDTLLIETPKSIFHVLKASDDLGEVTISARRKSTATSYLSSQNISTISSTELLKAACCNLSESFETNPQMKVNLTKAISEKSKIKILG